MDMLTHAQIWEAIDALATKYELSASGLARNSGLDPTTFNPSKRFTAEGRERWPSTESIAKILKCTGTSVDSFMALINLPEGASSKVSYRDKPKPPSIPLIGFAEAGEGGYFDDGGFPTGHGWDMIEAPTSPRSDGSYALKVSGDSMLPLYREGDILIVNPGVIVRKGDRVVAKTRKGEVIAKVLARKTSSRIEFQSLNPEHPDRSFSPGEVEWLARIVWASQ